MTFYGREDNPAKPVVSPMKTFHFLTEDRNKVNLLHEGREPKVHEVKAEMVFFYESGHVGFWNDLPEGGRKLVLAVKATDVWEDD